MTFRSNKVHWTTYEFRVSSYHAILNYKYFERKKLTFCVDKGGVQGGDNTSGISCSIFADTVNTCKSLKAINTLSFLQTVHKIHTDTTMQTTEFDGSVENNENPAIQLLWWQHWSWSGGPATRPISVGGSSARTNPGRVYHSVAAWSHAWCSRDHGMILPGQIVTVTSWRRATALFYTERGRSHTSGRGTSSGCHGAPSTGRYSVGDSNQNIQSIIVCIDFDINNTLVISTCEILPHIEISTKIVLKTIKEYYNC